jgi:DnaJ-class molecular chaperone
MLKKTLVLLLCVAPCWITTGCFQTDDLHDLVNDDLVNDDPGNDDPGNDNTEKAKEVIRLCYEILNVDRNASPRKIQKAYLKLALKYHPDKGGNCKVFLAINEAHEILKKYSKQENTSEDAVFVSDNEDIKQKLGHTEKILREGLEIMQTKPQTNKSPQAVNNDTKVEGTTTTIADID